MCVSFISPEDYQILCQQVQPLVPGPIGPYVPSVPGIGPRVPVGPNIGPYVPYNPYGPGPYVPAIPVPEPPDLPGVVPPLRIVPGMFLHQVGVKNTYPHHTRSSPRPQTQSFQENWSRLKPNPHKVQIFQDTD